MIIADTNVVSEFMRDRPAAPVLAWASSLSAFDVTICVVTVEEIERGLARLPDGRRRDDLQQRWAALIRRFEGTVVVYDVPAAAATARVSSDALDRGRPMSLADAQIAGICLASGAPLATRNVTDFEGVSGLTVVNPFNAS